MVLKGDKGFKEMVKILKKCQMKVGGVVHLIRALPMKLRCCSGLLTTLHTSIRSKPYGDHKMAGDLLTTKTQDCSHIILIY